MVRHSLPVLRGEVDQCSCARTAGWTYCGIGVLKLLDRLPPIDSNQRGSPTQQPVSKINVQDLLRWLLSRQTLYLQEEDGGAFPEEEYPDLMSNGEVSSFQKGGAHPATSLDLQGAEEVPIELSAEELKCAGFNGRNNKVADTCYGFWVGASLAV